MGFVPAITEEMGVQLSFEGAPQPKMLPQDLGGAPFDAMPLIEHPMFGETEIINAMEALVEAGSVDPEHPFVKERATVRRRLDQLAIPRHNENRIYVSDPNREHGSSVVRTLAGQTALSDSASVALSVPSAQEAEANRRALEGLDKMPNHITSDHLVDQAGGALIGVVFGYTSDIHAIATASAQAGDDKKTFFNLSLGLTVNSEADRITNQMMLAEPGSQLFEEAKAVLDEAPRYTKIPRKDGRTLLRLDKKHHRKLKESHVLPKLDALLANPQFEEAMGDARAQLDIAVNRAKDSRVMVFKAGSNAYNDAVELGRPELSEGVMSGIEGFFHVGGSEINGPGADDDSIAAFSTAGLVDAVAPAVDIPVGVKDGETFNEMGNSFATPIMLDTAYVMSGANPQLSLDDIEAILKDPRVARDIEGTTRDGAGSVDSFAAILLSQHPNLSRGQINQIAKALDASPNASFQIAPDGALQKLR